MSHRGNGNCDTVEVTLSYEKSASTSQSGMTNETNPTDGSVKEELPSKTTTEHPLSSTDLIKYSYQCSKGMEYIASRKLVHRDLAARNVLITKDDIVKIGDFGLSRDEIYLYNNVKKNALPIRWMAPESLLQNRFTSKSDVWSFGVLLWEIFTVGDNPYAGMPVGEEFYKKIDSGYRLKIPDMTPWPVSMMMQDCWQADPGDRPSFAETTERFCDVLQGEVINYYYTLNAPYEEANKITRNRAAARMSGNGDVLHESLSDAGEELSEDQTKL